MAWDKKLDRALARKARYGRILHSAADGPYVRPQLAPKSAVPAVVARSRKVRIKV